MSTFIVTKTEYSCKNWSISRLSSFLFVLSPGYQHQCHWLCRANRFFSFTNKDFSHLCVLGGWFERIHRGSDENSGHVYHYDDVMMGAMASQITCLPISLLNRLFRRGSKKTSKFRVTDLCVGNSPGTSDFPAQMASNAENGPLWWRHQVCGKDTRKVKYEKQTNSTIV